MPDSNFVKRLKDTTVAGWKLEEFLGEGASGAVFRGRNGDQVAAIKIYKQDIIEELGVYNQTIRIIRQMNLIDTKHPNLISILDGGKDEESKQLYLCMEYLEAEPLDKVGKEAPVERIGPLIAQIADAAEFLEQHGLTHRDIKPANVVVGPGFRKATLLDLGVLGPLSDLGPKMDINITDDSRHRRFLGTTRYSPPEYLERKEEPTTKSYRAITFYQLGAVLHDLLTGKEMFSDVSNYPPTALTDAVRYTSPSLDDLRTGVDARLVELARNCLQKDAQKRLDAVKWESFRCARWIRRPTVIMLYTGGTIGASVDNDKSHQRRLRLVDSTRHELIQAFQRRIARDYTQLYGAGIGMPFDLVWEILPQKSNSSARTPIWTPGMTLPWSLNTSVTSTSTALSS